MKTKTFITRAGTAAGVITALAIFEAVQIGMIKVLFDENEELHKVNREMHDNNIILRTKLGLNELGVEDIETDSAKLEEDVEQSENDISEHDEVESSQALFFFFLYFHKNVIREKNKPFYRKRKKIFLFINFLYFFLEVKENGKQK